MSRKPFTILVSIPLKSGRAEEFLALLNRPFINRLFEGRRCARRGREGMG
jgi:hypothetical protein